MGNHKHGLRHTRIYNIWRSMRQRCNNPNNNRYRNYGGKGITVCEEWNDPRVFAEWAYNNGYSDDLTIDRIDTSKGYTPENCRWTTYTTQENNRTNNVFYECKGERHTLTEWARITNMNPGTLWARIHKYGMPVEDAISKPKWHKDTRYKRKNTA